MRWYLPDRWPLFWYDLRRRFRGRRWFVLPVVVLGMLVLVAGIAILLFIISFQHLFSRGEFLIYLATPFKWLLIIIFAPALSAGVISTERQHGSLEFLFLTPLTSRQIVCQHYAGILVPISAMMQIFIPADLYTMNQSLDPVYVGTIDEWLLERINEILVILCSCAIGLYFSSITRNVRTAMVVSYVVVVLVLLFIPFFINTTLSFLYDSDSYRYLALYWIPLIYLLLAAYSLWGSIHAIERQRNPRPSSNLRNLRLTR